MRSALTVVAPAAEFLANLLWITVKVIVALVIYFVCLALALLSTGIVMDAMGLSYDQAHYIGLMVAMVVAMALGLRLFRWSFGKKLWIKWGGPGSDAYNSDLRRTVQNELTRHGPKKPTTHP